MGLCHRGRARGLTLEHVHVHEGAQAIVDNVESRGGGITPKSEEVGKRWAPTASDIEGPTDLDGVGVCFQTEISRCALDSYMAQECSNCLQIASTFQNVESLRPT